MNKNIELRNWIEHELRRATSDGCDLHLEIHTSSPPTKIHLKVREVLHTILVGVRLAGFSGDRNRPLSGVMGVSIADIVAVERIDAILLAKDRPIRTTTPIPPTSWSSVDR